MPQKIKRFIEGANITENGLNFRSLITIVTNEQMMPTTFDNDIVIFQVLFCQVGLVFWQGKRKEKRNKYSQGGMLRSAIWLPVSSPPPQPPHLWYKPPMLLCSFTVGKQCNCCTQGCPTIPAQVLCLLQGGCSHAALSGPAVLITQSRSDSNLLFFSTTPVIFSLNVF